jgi:Fic-DOC domain mobile mystery protein B
MIAASIQPGLFAASPGETPLEPGEIEGLIPSHIAYRHELNFAEQANIARGSLWARRYRKDILNEKFILELHRRMFGDVWRWAGSYRLTQRNLGLDYWCVPVEVRRLLDDCQAWIEFQAYAADEIGVRLHHRMVAIHPFPNGNGRHTRLLADLAVQRLGARRYSWGGVNLQSPGETRQAYIAALRAADLHDYEPLLAFARS